MGEAPKQPFHGEPLTGGVKGQPVDYGVVEALYWSVPDSLRQG